MKKLLVFLFFTITVVSYGQESAGSAELVQPEAKTANVRNNWISIEIYGELGTYIRHPIRAGLGIGVFDFFSGFGIRYERMLNSRISIGANAYWSTITTMISDNHNFGVDACFRLYLWGKTFYKGFSVGFGYNFNYGAAITPETGWKIDIGKAGDFFLPVGMAVPLLFGKNRSGNFGLIYAGYRLYIGMGYAF